MLVSLCSLIAGVPAVSGAPSTLKSPGTLSFTQWSSDRFVAPDCNVDERSLLNIIWSCASTLFICTWVTAHPNIPRANATRWSALRERLYLVFVGVISPEIVVMLAARQYYGTKRMVSKYRAGGINITETQAHFIQMGGFLLFRKSRPLGILPSYILFRLLAARDFDYDARFEPKAKDVSFRLPSDKEIWDRSKGDWVSKALGFFQVSWFTLQCTSRWASGLVVTRLELVTFALAALNGLIYFLWWNKPVDIRFQETVLWVPDDTEYAWEELITQDDSAFISEGPAIGESWWRAPVYIWLNIRSLVQFLDFQYSTSPLEGMMRVFIACTELGSDESQLAVVSISCWSAVLFGAIHLVAWQSSFLSSSEQVVWRICAVLTTTAPFVPFVWRYCWQFDFDKVVRTMTPTADDPLTLTVLKRMTYALIPIYTLARVGILVISISSLRDPVSGTFSDINWSAYVPHF